MSTFSGTHLIQSYSGKEHALMGQRLVTVTYKKDSEGIKKPSICVSIPSVEVFTPQWIEQNNTWVQSTLRGVIEREQDLIVRGIHEGKSTNVSDNDISIEKCISNMSISASGGRLNKEQIGEWFLNHMEDGLLEALTIKMGITDTTTMTTEQISKIESLIASFKVKFTNLASPMVKYDTNTCIQLMKALDYCADKNDSICMKFINRITDMMNTHEIIDAL